MTLLLHTTRIGSPFARSRVDVLDITRKSGSPLGKVFAPSWAILSPALAARRAGRDEEHWPVYVEAYAAEMRENYRRSRKAWDGLLALSSVTLVCYCVDGARCHRRLLAGMLARLGAEDRGEQ